MKLLVVCLSFLLVATIVVATGVQAECPAGYFVVNEQPGAAWYNIDIDGTIYPAVAHTNDAATGKDCLYDVTGLGTGQHTLQAQSCFTCSGALAAPDCVWCADWADITAVKPEVAGGLSFQW